MTNQLEEQIARLNSTGEGWSAKAIYAPEMSADEITAALLVEVVAGRLHHRNGVYRKGPRG